MPPSPCGPAGPRQKGVKRQIRLSVLARPLGRGRGRGQAGKGGRISSSQTGVPESAAPHPHLSPEAFPGPLPGS